MKQEYTFTGKATHDESVHILSEALGFTEDDMKFLHKIAIMRAEGKGIFPELIDRGQLNILLYLSVRGMNHLLDNYIADRKAPDNIIEAIDRVISKIKKDKKNE